MKIKVKKVRDIQLPSYHYSDDSGMDLINADKEVVINPGERKLIPSGIKVAIPKGHEIQVRSRSGLAIKKGVMTLNSPGTIDAGYRGEICVILFNSSDKPVTIKKGERIAQAVLQKIENIQWEETDTLPPSERSTGGFGSTG
ncbi:MAG: dUTP diphosphatase [Elusimicrobiota bacterium]